MNNLEVSYKLILSELRKIINKNLSMKELYQEVLMYVFSSVIPKCLL